MVDLEEDLNFDWLKGGSDERNRLLENLPILAMFFFMLLIFIPQIPQTIKPYLMFGGLGFAVLTGALSEWALKVKASEYQVFKAVVRPTNKTFYLFSRKPRIELDSQLIDPTNQIYQTTLDLVDAEELDLDKGKSSRIKIKHYKPWSERMMLLPGYVTYKGFPGLAHNSMANIVLWEPKEEKGELDPELMEWVPYYWLAEAPRDWIIMTEPSEFPENNGHDRQVGTEIEVIAPSGLPVTLTKELYEDVKHERDHWKTVASMRQQNIARTGPLTRDLANTTFAAFAKVRDQGKLVLEEIIACLHAHTDIEEAAREYKPFSWPKFGMAAAITIISLAFLALVGINEEFRTALFANIGYLVIGVIGVLALIIYLRGKVKI